MKEVYSITTNLSRYGGAQKVLVDVHNGIKKQFAAKVIGFQKYSSLHAKYNISNEEYIKLKYPWQLNDKILLIHARNVLPLIMLMKWIFFLNVEVVYISHNVYSTYKALTFFPKHIISISNKVTENLILFFGVKKSTIHLIYNGLPDSFNSEKEYIYKADGVIRILYPARVNHVKRQLAIVANLKDILPENIEIHFAGHGEQLEDLVNVCAGLKNFKVLGFVEDMNGLISKYDYLMLYSIQEGLPLSLIEGIMHGKPLLVNDVGGNLEIGVPGLNSLLLGSSWSEVQKQLCLLNDIETAQYLSMSTKSRELFLKKFRFELMIENYLNYLKNINKK